MASKITSLNWNTAYYFSDNLIAFISLGAAPTDYEQEVIVQYYVTLSSKDYEDLYQSSHKDIEDAVTTLNQRYGDWQFKSLQQGDQDASDSGCSSCAAH